MSAGNANRTDANVKFSRKIPDLQHYDFIN